MLRLLHSIFGGREERGRYPASLIELATERVVEGTDPRLRALSGLARRLHDPIVKSIDHVIGVVHGIQGFLEVNAAAHGSDPRLGALFASAESMFDILGRDQALREYLDSSEGRGAWQVFGLLMADRMERNVLGLDLVGDQIRRDVAQVVVSFVNHRLLEPNVREEEGRRQLMRRAFDFLLTQALDRISEVKLERADLTRQRDLLRRKLSALENGGWGFKPLDPHHPDLATLMAELDEVTGQLEELGPDQEILEAHLEIVIEVLDNPGQHLWVEPITLYLDAMNIVREPKDAAARRLDFLEFRGGRGQRAVTLPISLQPALLPAREDFLAALDRYY